MARNPGEQEHAWVQGRIFGWFFLHEEEWRIRVLPEQRVQVASTRFRVPDVTILRALDPFTPIVHKAPLVCIEIMSSEDRLNAVQVRLQNLLDMGVENIWLVNPFKRLAWTYSESGLEPLGGDAFRVNESDIYLPLVKVFEGLPA